MVDCLYKAETIPKTHFLARKLTTTDLKMAAANCKSKCKISMKIIKNVYLNLSHPQQQQSRSRRDFFNDLQRIRKQLSKPNKKRFTNLIRVLVQSKAGMYKTNQCPRLKSKELKFFLIDLRLI